MSNEAVAAIAERMGNATNSSSYLDLDNLLDEVGTSDPSDIHVNILLAEIERKLLECIDEVEPQGLIDGHGPIIVGVLKQPSIVCRARAYGDGSSLVLVPNEFLSLIREMCRSSIFLIAELDEPPRVSRRGWRRRKVGNGLYPVAAAVAVEWLERLRRFHEPGTPTPGYLAWPFSAEENSRRAVAMVRAAYRCCIILKRTFNVGVNMPFILNEDNEERSFELANLTWAFVLAHESAHILLGHLKSRNSSPVKAEEELQQFEFDADRLAMQLVVRYAIKEYRAEPNRAEFLARAAASIALGVNSFHSTGLMIRDSDSHPGPEARLWEALNEMESGNETAAYLLSFVTMFGASYGRVPLDEKDWIYLRQDRRARFDEMFSNGPGVLFDNIDLLDALAGAPLESFVDRPENGVRTQRAFTLIAEKDARPVLEALGVGQKQIEYVLDQSKALSFFNLVEILRKSEALREEEEGESARVVAAQFAHYLGPLLR
ncbi:hypothetical protein ACIRP3_29330 [Streptomyces sp. NPDC101209]|uniref:hypothetical protein n=1 Tax=Streptomyces sp. NPDC101209 TaxID=3366129 RepID=UPI00382DEEB4